MYTKEKIQEIILATFVADSYSLGAHWVYDENQLAELKVDWNSLNTPQAMWHRGKDAGDFTHIGDQAFWLYEFLKDKDSFSKDEYFTFWQEKMASYEGYIDGATRNTLENIKNGNMIGSDSTDFSVIGRVASLLLVSKNEEEFLANVEEFVKLSHNSSKVIEVAKFFAKLTLEVENKTILEAINSIKDEFSEYVQSSVVRVAEDKNEDSFKIIRYYGPACDIDEGFLGIIHLLIKYDNLKELLVNNAKAGGDSASRAMVASMVFVAKNGSADLPKEWFLLNKKS